MVEAYLSKEEGPFTLRLNAFLKSTLVVLDRRALLTSTTNSFDNDVCMSPHDEGDSIYIVWHSWNKFTAITVRLCPSGLFS